MIHLRLEQSVLIYEMHEEGAQVFWTLNSYLYYIITILHRPSFKQILQKIHMPPVAS